MKVLRAYPSCPGAARLGIGYCRYRLGQFDKARQAFHRVLDLDPENIDALVALGIMELQTNEGEIVLVNLGGSAFFDVSHQPFFGSDLIEMVHVRSKLSKQERVALVRASRGDREKYEAKTIVKQKKVL
ncbi:hypothetical protein HPP92_028483 [Vanilla planifolia]|uniref:Tetratricopeptide repeat protein n=1 Tax=Vanilla planifolia TaxID=51239 RepID=A0A835PAT0_VANPL|nr:hypothetical protein HPP92_028483 [Vanilla planifolia]